MQYKIGDEVVLRPETKPYTKKSHDDGDIVRNGLIDELVYIVDGIHADGDIYVIHDGIDYGYIQPHHLKHSKEDTEFEDYHEKLYQNYSDSFNDLESDLKAELEKIKDIDIVELRLAIFNGDTSRTLEEMKAIEKWLLGDK